MVRLLLSMILICMTPGACAQHRPAESVETGSEKRDFLVLGASIGSPAGVSLVGGFYADRAVVRLSGGYWKKEWNGIQGDVGVILGRGVAFAMGISLLAGGFEADPLNSRGERELHRVSYVGVAYDMYLSGFFLQAGLGCGKGDYPNPQVILQFGYLFAIQ